MSTLQAFVVAGGRDDGDNRVSSVLTLLPGAPAWTPLSSLPRALDGARASIVGGKVRVTGGFDGRARRSEVMVTNWFWFSATLVQFCSSRFLSTIQNHGTSGWPLEALKLEEAVMLCFQLELSTCLVCQVRMMICRKLAIPSVLLRLLSTGTNIKRKLPFIPRSKLTFIQNSLILLETWHPNRKHY